MHAFKGNDQSYLQLISLNSGANVKKINKKDISNRMFKQTNFPNYNNAVELVNKTEIGKGCLENNQ